MKLRIAFYALPYCSKKRNPSLKIIITGIFLRDGKFSCFRIIVPQINQLLKIFTSANHFIDFLEPTKDWLKCNGDLIISCSGLINCVFQNLEIKSLHLQFLHCYNSTNLYQRIQNLFLLVHFFVSLSFYLSVSVKLIHPVTLLLTSPLLKMKNIPHRIIM